MVGFEKKKKKDWLDWRSTDVELSQEFVLSKCLLYLGTVISTRHWILSSVWALPSSVWGWAEGRIDSQRAENTCRHANTTWEGGGNRKFGFMSIVTNPQVSSNEHTHTAMESSDIKSPAGRESPKAVLCLCNRSFLLFFSSFLFYIRLFASEFLGSFFFSLLSFVLNPQVCSSSHSDGESLAHLLPNDFLTAVRTLSVVSRQRPSEPQQVPANAKPHRSGRHTL